MTSIVLRELAFRIAVANRKSGLNKLSVWDCALKNTHNTQMILNHNENLG